MKICNYLENIDSAFDLIYCLKSYYNELGYITRKTMFQENNELKCGAFDQNPTGLRNLNKNDEFDFDRTKVFCRFAGCESNVSSKHHTLCDAHMNTKKCCLSSCQNTADENDLGMCLQCYQMKKGSFKDSSILMSQKKDEFFDRKNKNSKDFISTLDNLPPLPSSDLMQRFNEQNLTKSEVFINKSSLNDNFTGYMHPATDYMHPPNHNDNFTDYMHPPSVKKTDYEDFNSIVDSLPLLPSTRPNHVFDEYQERSQVYSNGDKNKYNDNFTGYMHQARNVSVKNTNYEGFNSTMEFLPPLPSARPNNMFDEYQEKLQVYSNENKNKYPYNNARFSDLPHQNQILNQSFRNSHHDLHSSFTNKICRKCNARTAVSNGICSNCSKNYSQYSNCVECKKMELVSNLHEGLLCEICHINIYKPENKPEKSKIHSLDYCMQKPFYHENHNNPRTQFEPNHQGYNYQDRNYQEHNYQPRNYADPINRLSEKKNDAVPCSSFGCALFTVLPTGKCHKCESQSNKYDLKCLKINCEFFGSPEFNGLCSGCFMAMTIGESRQRQTSQSR
ncbi:uncharacterized protein LOC100201096 isoform X2 [Hydra vulgaris]|uniref:uncharacterized protein LOC100201096 isoform X2 n=1 Tax=Hydra vulgaris TaxID=6087 RepID=UPI0006410236|nr:uncharacterized protein LOC100201096 isoform X2 [Hydra vulgaris]